MSLYGVVLQIKASRLDLTECEALLKVVGCKDTHTYTPTVDYSPSDYSTLQVINLDEFTKAAGVVVVGCLGVPKGLTETTGEDRNTG